MKYQKFKQMARLNLFGFDDLLKSNSVSIHTTPMDSVQYYDNIVGGITAYDALVTTALAAANPIPARPANIGNNAKTLRFKLDGLNGVQLSNNAKLVLESLFIPSLFDINLNPRTTGPTIIRMKNLNVYNNFDSSQKTSGDPVVFISHLSGNTQNINVAPTVSFSTIVDVGSLTTAIQTAAANVEIAQVTFDAATATAATTAAALQTAQDAFDSQTLAQRIAGTFLAPLQAAQAAVNVAVGALATATTNLTNAKTALATAIATTPGYPQPHVTQPIITNRSSYSNGNAFINPDPKHLYNFSIPSNFLCSEMLEIELTFTMAYGSSLLTTIDQKALDNFHASFVIYDIDEEDALFYETPDIDYKKFKQMMNKNDGRGNY